MLTRKSRHTCEFCHKRHASAVEVRVHKRRNHLSQGSLCPFCSTILPDKVLSKHVATCQKQVADASDAYVYSSEGSKDDSVLELLPRLAKPPDESVHIDWSSLLARVGKTDDDKADDDDDHAFEAVAASLNSGDDGEEDLAPVSREGSLIELSSGSDDDVSKSKKSSSNATTNEVRNLLEKDENEVVVGSDSDDEASQGRRSVSGRVRRRRSRSGEEVFDLDKGVVEVNGVPLRRSKRRRISTDSDSLSCKRAKVDEVKESAEMPAIPSDDEKDALTLVKENGVPEVRLSRVDADDDDDAGGDDGADLLTAPDETEAEAVEQEASGRAVRSHKLKAIQKLRKSMEPVTVEDSDESWENSEQEELKSSSSASEASCASEESDEEDGWLRSDDSDAESFKSVDENPTMDMESLWAASDRDKSESGFLKFAAPFANLLLAYLVDPASGHIAPPLPPASSLPVVESVTGSFEHVIKTAHICEICGLLATKSLSKHKEMFHSSTVGLIPCCYCTALYPAAFYPLHSTLMCRSRPGVRPREKNNCNLCSPTLELRSPFHLLWHAIQMHSQEINEKANRFMCPECEGTFLDYFFDAHSELCHFASSMGVALPTFSCYDFTVKEAVKMVMDIIGARSSPGSSPSENMKSKEQNNRASLQRQCKKQVLKSNTQSNLLSDVLSVTSNDLESLASSRKMVKESDSLSQSAMSPESSRAEQTIVIVEEERMSKKEMFHNLPSLFLYNIYEPVSPQVSDDESDDDDDNVEKNIDLDFTPSIDAGKSNEVKAVPEASSKVAQQLTGNSGPDTEADANDKEEGTVDVIPTAETVQVNENGEDKPTEEGGDEIVMTEVEKFSDYGQFMCDFCGKHTNKLSHMLSHKRKHKASIRCPLCLSSLPKVLLYCHRRIFCTNLHGEVAWSLKCSLCNLLQRSPIHLLRHAIDDHPDHVTTTRDAKARPNEPERVRCQHCAAPVRPIFFDCHQEMCLRKLNYEMKARPKVKGTSTDEANNEEKQSISNEAELTSSPKQGGAEVNASSENERQNTPEAENDNVCSEDPANEPPVEGCVSVTVEVGEEMAEDVGNVDEATTEAADLCKESESGQHIPECPTDSVDGAPKEDSKSDDYVRSASPEYEIEAPNIEAQSAEQNSSIEETDDREVDTETEPLGRTSTPNNCNGFGTEKDMVSVPAPESSSDPTSGLSAPLQEEKATGSPPPIENKSEDEKSSSALCAPEALATNCEAMDIDIDETVLEPTASDEALFEDISEVLELVMREDNENQDGLCDA